MNGLRNFVLIGFTTLVVAACGSNQASSGGSVSVVNSNAGANASRPPQADAIGLIAAGEQESQPTIPLSDAQRVILKNASLTLTVEQPAAHINQIATMAEGMGGWVVSSNTYISSGSQGEETTNGTIVVRVPAEWLDEALTQIKSGALKVDNENITGEDVTQEYVDLTSRLENLKATEQQLRAIMDTATKVDDVLAVQRELTTVRGDIEVIQGRLNYFDEAAAYSSISVTVYPKAPGPLGSQSLSWNPTATAEGALGTLVNILQFLLDAAIVIVIIGVPLALVIGVPGWFIWRILRRFRPKRVQPDASSSDSTGET